MRQLELLAPARDLQIGIAAIDCGADAVYIAGPRFGARHAAGNEIEDIRQLCDYAHKFGVRIFVTLNTIIYEEELEEAYRMLIQVQEAGADAVIIQDLSFIEMARNGLGNLREKIRIPLHASTQCAIRTPEQARFLESLGFSRLILERELSLEQIRAIRNAVSCELEFFVHGALCVCYSGQCYLSEMIAGRSANRGACIQACRSRYDLADASGKILIKDKALLSLKDFNLKEHLCELAEAGITSFKIEGRLKNSSYVKNVVRDYSLAIDRMMENNPGKYERASFGYIRKGFMPDTSKTFNRGYTSLFIEGKRGKWACSDAAKSMGEEIGEITGLNRDKSQITVRFFSKGTTLNNGDGFSFVSKDGNVLGVRGDVCKGNVITCKSMPGLYIGARLYRNINAAFEKELDRQSCTREILCSVEICFSNNDGVWTAEAIAASEDGRRAPVCINAGSQRADNQERMREMILLQIGKSALHYNFSLGRIDIPQDGLPLMSAASLNSIRRTLAEQLDQTSCRPKPLSCRTEEAIETRVLEEHLTYKANVANILSGKVYKDAGAKIVDPAYEISHEYGAELIRSRYCIRYELGMCPKYQKESRHDLPASLSCVKPDTQLFLLNNGRRLALGFDCRLCEMTVREG